MSLVENKINDKGYIETPFDGYKALIRGDHPHSGNIAECLGAQKVSVGAGWALRFKDEINEFFVIKTEHIKWIVDETVQ